MKHWIQLLVYLQCYAPVPWYINNALQGAGHMGFTYGSVRQVRWSNMDGS
jgi:hypothetical protein